MAIENSLALTFVCENTKKNTISITGVKTDLTDEQVQTLMDTIVEKNIFATRNGGFVSKDSAKLIKKETTEYSLS